MRHEQNREAPGGASRGQRGEGQEWPPGHSGVRDGRDAARTSSGPGFRKRPLAAFRKRHQKARRPATA